MSAFRPTIWRQFLRDYLAVLALVAVVARALIPTGYMPAMVGGHVQMVICQASAAGVVHHGHDSQDPAGADSPCPFALAGGAAPLPEWPPAIPTLAVTGAPLHLSLSAPVVEVPARHRAPRGPPTLA